MVEDDPDHAILTIRSLRKAGFEQQVVWVKDGREALEHLPDLLLVDA
ncbi:MAG TPA: response regulator, partial [Armatimonadota bacterium]|nr:response regulator [Armatimonadota bacterium]